MGLHTNRRGFLTGAAAASAALAVGFDATGTLAADAGDEIVVNPFVVLDAEGGVTVVVKHFEMGQGTTTGLTTLVAEEMDADWRQMNVAFAPADASRYANLAFGGQGTGGSTAMANSWLQYRQAGAAARALLLDAAAREWGLDAADLSIAEGIVSAPDGRQASFGQLTPLAHGLAAPAEPRLKDPSGFRLIGNENLRRYDSAAKTDGSATFAIDVMVDGMVHAVIARSPKFGGVVSAFDATETLKVRGVVDVKQIPAGVAVYAESTWAAIKGRDALDVTWDFSAAETRSSDEIMAALVASLDADGLPARNDGDALTALAEAEGGRIVEADFTFPFLSHAPLEPLNCVIAVEDGRAKVWDGCQFPAITQPTVAAITGLPADKVEIETVYAGGSFGRRATPNSDYQAEAAMAAAAIGFGRPVKLVWTREDDIQGGFYRPAYAQRIRAAIGPDGAPIAWEQRLAGKPILIGTPFEAFLVKDGIDSTSVEGAATLPYAIPNLRVDIRNAETPVPVLWWRAVGHTHTAYSTEVMIDMLAEAAEADPVAYRLALLEDHPRHAGALRLAAEKAGWDKPLPKGWGRGVAVHESFSSYVAQVVEVSQQDDGALKIERVVCAVDCGVVVNPDVVRAQMEGGIGYGLGAILRNKITLTDGEVDQTNYWDYEPLRLTDMPKIEVHMVASAEAPTGVGEPGTPPIGPALANAVRSATGQNVLDLPMIDAGVEFA